MIIALNDELLNGIVERCYNMGRLQGAIDSGKAPAFMTQNKAYARYGKGNVQKWIASGLVRRIKDADGAKSSNVRLDAMELEAAAFKCNPIDLSPKAKNEMASLASRLGY